MPFTGAAAKLLIMVPISIKITQAFDDTWMTNKSSPQFEQLAATAVSAVSVHPFRAIT